MFPTVWFTALLLAAAPAAPSTPASKPEAPKAANPGTKTPPAAPVPQKTAARPAAPTATSANLLANPGFEAGRERWTSMGGQNWGAFEIADAPVRSGAHAARLVVRADAKSPEKAKVFGVVQEIRRDALPGGFPETVSGWYRVNAWSKPAGTADLYLQAVVIVWGDPRTPRLIGQPPGQKPVTNYQIRFYLAGLTEPAFRLSNARLDFVQKGDPVQGQWVRFQIPVRQKFQELWGSVPADFEFIRILFEARWDNKPPGAELAADVCYDDLFFGYGAPPDAAR